MLRRSTHLQRAATLGVVTVLVMGTAAIGADDAGSARAGLFESTWPTGRSDQWRTGAAQGAGLPADFDPTSLVAATAPLPPVPMWGVTDTADAIFVLGGSPYLIDLFSNASLDDGGVSPAQDRFAVTAAVSATVAPYVAKIDPATMTVTDTLELPRGSTLNYTSSLALHANGHLYTIAAATLYEIDPETMAIVHSLALPTFDSAPGQTIYNSVQVSPLNGDIITKGIDAGDSSEPAKLLSIDTSDLSLRFASDVPIASTRIGTVLQGDELYVYASDDTRTQRFSVTDDAFVTDEAWAETYRTPGDGTTPAVSMVNMGPEGPVLFPNNNTVIYGVSAPLQLYVQATTTTEDTLTSMDATSVTGPGGTFYPAVADPYVTRMVVANDQMNRVIAGWNMADDGTMTKVWETHRYRSSAGSAIASDQGQLYIDDLRCEDGDIDCSYYLVVLDVTTGEQLAEIEVAGTTPSLGQIFLGKDDLFFISSEAGKGGGFITRVSVR